MTSEIRANTLKNRVGLGTISFTNTGPVVSGIVTAEGTSITLINKENALNTLLTVENTLTGNAGVKIKNADGEFTFLANERLRIMDEGAGGIERVSILSGNVGINSTSPKARLDVNGNVSITGVTTTTGNIHLNSTDKKIYLTNDYDQYITANAASNYMAFAAGNQERLRILSDGKVGIGTDNPNARLRIHDDSDNTAIIWISGADVVSEYLSLGIQSGLAVIRGGGTGSTSTALSFETSTSGTESEKMRLDANGILKLGTSLGASHVGNVPSDIKFFLNSGRGNYGGLSASAVIFDNQTAAVDAGGTLTLAGFTGSGAIAKAAIRGGNEGSSSTNNGYFTVFTRPTSGSLTERLRITSAGSVGINQDNPHALLSLGAGVNAIKLLLYDNEDNNKYGFGIQSNELRQFYPSDSRMVIGTIATSDGSTFSEKLRINNAGSVSIGNNPTVHSDTIFHVEKSSGETNVKFEGNDTMGARLSLHNNKTTGTGLKNQIDFCDAGGQSTSSIQAFNTDQTNNLGELVFATRSAQGTPPQERLRIISSGEVSIGGFTPTASAGILQISGGLRVAGSASASDTTTPYIYRTSGVDNLNFATSGVERVQINSTGTTTFKGHSTGTEQVKIQSNGGGTGLFIGNFQGIDAGDASSRLGVGKNDNALIFTNASGSQISNFAIGNTDSVPLVLSTHNKKRFEITGPGIAIFHDNQGAYTNTVQSHSGEGGFITHYTARTTYGGADLYRRMLDIASGGANPHGSHIRFLTSNNNSNPATCIERMRIMDDGGVYIGTKTHTQRYSHAEAPALLTVQNGARVNTTSGVYAAPKGGFCDHARYELEQKLINISNSNLGLVQARNGQPLTINNSRDSWSYYDNLPNYLLGHASTDNINNSSFTLTLYADMTVFLIRNAGWNGITNTYNFPNDWTKIEDGVTMSPSGTSNVWVTTVPRGAYAWDNDSAMYIFVL